MEIVHRGDPGNAEHPAVHFGNGDVAGDGFQQDVGALPHEPPGPDQDKEGESDGNDRIGDGPAGETPVTHAVENAQADQIDQQAAGGDEQEKLGPDGSRVSDPLNCFDDHPGGDAEERGTVD